MESSNSPAAEEFCRICVLRKNSLFSLYRKRNNAMSPFEKLMSCTKLKIDVKDGGPDSICSQCLADLDVTVKFLIRCEQSSQLLASLHLTKLEDDTSQPLKPIPTDHHREINSLNQNCSVEEHDTVIGAPSMVDDTESDSEPTDPNLIPLAHLEPLTKCVECGSKRRCKHWTPPTEFKCQYCDKVFNRKFNFVLHMKRHAGDKEFPCQVCGARFVTRSLATRHCLPRPRHLCPEPGCEKSFTTTTNLRTHVRMHNGERPYQCSTCGKHFACKNTLNDHKRIHTGEKPYVCPACGKCFTTNKLSAHMRTHYPATPRAAPPRARPAPPRPAPPAPARVCPRCGARYAHGQSLNKHMRKAHGQKPKPPTRESFKQLAIDEG